MEAAVPFKLAKRITPLSSKEDENESTIPPGSTFKVTWADSSGSQAKAVLKEVPKPAKQAPTQ